MSDFSNYNLKRDGPFGTCNITWEHHVAELVTDVDVDDVLYDTCPNCKEFWIIGHVSHERAESIRRARRLARGKP